MPQIAPKPKESSQNRFIFSEWVIEHEPELDNSFTEEEK
jgi:hypothetical protein